MELTRRKGSVVYDENTDTLDFEGHKFTGEFLRHVSEKEAQERVDKAFKILHSWRSTLEIIREVGTTHDKELGPVYNHQAAVAEEALNKAEEDLK